MTTKIFAINYDFWYELDEGYHAKDDKINLNQKGEQYVFVNNNENFFETKEFPSFGGLTFEEAKDKVNQSFNQQINWDEQLTDE